MRSVTAARLIKGKRPARDPAQCARTTFMLGLWLLYQLVDISSSRFLRIRWCLKYGCQLCRTCSRPVYYFTGNLVVFPVGFVRATEQLYKISAKHRLQSRSSSRLLRWPKCWSRQHSNSYPRKHPCTPIGSYAPQLPSNELLPSHLLS